jgi:hypothetical protein
MAEQYEAMRAHVRANHFPETTSQWPSLGREARLPPGYGNYSSRRRTSSGCTVFRPQLRRSQLSLSASSGSTGAEAQ